MMRSSSLFSNKVLMRVLAVIVALCVLYVVGYQVRVSSDRNSFTQIRPLEEREHTKGDRNSRVRMVLYSDIDCPYCHGFYLNSLPRLLQEFGTRIVLVYRHYPIVSLHPNAQIESETTECAYEQEGDEGFWNMVDAMYRSIGDSGAFDMEALPSIATRLHLNPVALERCMKEGKGIPWVQHGIIDAALASVYKTPSVVIEDIQTGTHVMVSGAAYANTKAALESMLQL